MGYGNVDDWTSFQLVAVVFAGSTTAVNLSAVENAMLLRPRITHVVLQLKISIELGVSASQLKVWAALFSVSNSVPLPSMLSGSLGSVLRSFVSQYVFAGWTTSNAASPAAFFTDGSDWGQAG